MLQGMTCGAHAHARVEHIILSATSSSRLWTPSAQCAANRPALPVPQKSIRLQRKAQARRERAEAKAWQANLAGINIEPADAPSKGVYLIAHPMMGLSPTDDMFHRSVVLLIYHGAEKTSGLIVNKHRGDTFRETVLPGTLPHEAGVFECFNGNRLRDGGPVKGKLAWLHCHSRVGGLALAEEGEEPVRSNTVC